MDKQTENLLIRLAIYGAVAYGIYLLVKKYAPSLNPVNPNNAAAQGANAIAQAITGNPNDTTGTAIYNATHSDESASATYRPMTFPDGSRQAVDMSTVDPTTGMFTYTDGNVYHMSQGGDGLWYAVPPPPSLGFISMGSLRAGPMRL